MGLEHDISVLARVALFSALNEEQLRLIAFGAEPCELAAGRLLCKSGESADGGFVLVEGNLARMSENGSAVEQIFDQPGTLIGELSLLTRCAWHSTLVAETNCRLLRLPRPLFRRILEEYPKTTLEFEKFLVADLSNKVRLMEKAASKLG